MKTIDARLTQVEEARQKDVEAANKKADEERAKILAEITGKVFDLLTELQTHIELVPKASRGPVLFSDKRFKKFVKDCDSATGNDSANATTKHKRISDDEILQFLGHGEKHGKEIAEHFYEGRKGSGSSVTQRMKPLLESKRVTVRKDAEDERQNIYKAAK